MCKACPSALSTVVDELTLHGLSLSVSLQFEASQVLAYLLKSLEMAFVEVPLRSGRSVVN